METVILRPGTVSRNGEEVKKEMLNLNSVIVFSDNPKRLGEFYKKLFGKDTDWSGGGFFGWKVGVGFLVIGPHDKVHGKSANPERLMFNFEAEDVKGEFARIKALGAKVIADPYHPSEEDKDDPKSLLATFADPDGNYFQVMSPMPM